MQVSDNLGRRRRGAIAVLLAFLIPVILLIAGFGVYIAWSQLVRTELRTATDFSARAGATRLSMDQTETAAVSAAIDSASRNQVGGQPLAVNALDIELGISAQATPADRFTFTPDENRINGVRVSGAFAGTDPTTSFLANISGVNNAGFQQASVATNLDRDICVVIDRSGSMTNPIDSTFNGTTQSCGPLPLNCRFRALADAVDAFLDELALTPQRELVSLASYSSRVNQACSCCDPVRVTHVLSFPESQIHSFLGDNPALIRAPIANMIELGISGSTAIGSGMRSGVQAVIGANARPFAAPTIVLMTDGVHNLGVSPLTVANEALAANIVVHTITFSRGANQSLMRQVAQITGGRHLHADDAGTLSESFREIARTLPVMLTE